MANFKHIERGVSYIDQLIAKNKIRAAALGCSAASPENSSHKPTFETAGAIFALSPNISPLADKESDETVIARLAAMTELEYDRARKDAADKLGVQLATLDKVIKAKRKEKQELHDNFMDEVEPWHEAVDPAILLDELVQTVRRFIVCDVETAQVAALWAVMTHLLDVIHTAPIAMITAPEKGSGKTQFLSLLGKLVLRPLPVSGISSAALFRVIEAWQPTMLIDETDTFLTDNEDMRQVLNAGHTRDTAYVMRCVGDNHEPKRFRVWGAKALSGINNKGKLNPTLLDRSIILELRKKLPTEQVDKLNRHSDYLFRTLQSRIARYALDYKATIQAARPTMPIEFDGRLEDNWEPIFAIADTAGQTWSNKIRLAALKISTSASQPSLGTELLEDIYEIFEAKRVKKLHTADLVAALCEDEEKPWATYNRGFAISPRQIANILSPYGIESRQVRIDYGNKKGYVLEDFEDAFARYVFPPDPAVLGETTKQSGVSKGTSVSGENSVSDTSETQIQSETGSPCNDAACSLVSHESAVIAVKDTVRPYPDGVMEVTL